MGQKTNTVIEDLEAKLHEATGSGAIDLRVQADLVTAHIYSWDKRSSSLTCYDFQTGQPIIVELPDNITPAEYASLLYKRARKMERSIEFLRILMPRAESIRQDLLTLECSLYSMNKLQDDVDLLTLQDLQSDLLELSLQPI